MTEAKRETAQRPEAQLIKERLRKLKELRELGVDPYPHSYKPTHHVDELRAKYENLAPDTTTEERVKIAGRLVLFRVMGKLAFGQLMDETGTIQIMLDKKLLEGSWPVVKRLDLGDLLGVEGTIITTRKGELTVRATALTLLTKSLKPLPEKHHGLKDVETRYRKRYLDLISNPEVKATFKKRSAIIKTFRAYLDERGFVEVETPTLQPLYGGANARPFITHHNALDIDLYLRISDELYLKRLLVGGFERVYELAKDFRNEGVDSNHNPEFTMIEWYMAYGDYHDGMRMVEEVIAKACKAVNGTTKITYQGEELDFTPPWRRVTMADAIKEHTGIDVLEKSEEELRNYCQQEGIECEQRDTWGLLVQHIFEEKCEEHLRQPTFVIDHPIETTPLCKPLRNGDARLVERFELFCAGMELANAYSELNDPVLQRKLFQDQHELKMAGDEEAHPMDTDFLEAIEHGMPPTSGVGIGIDRVVMLLTNSASIRDVILFPTMRPK